MEFLEFISEHFDIISFCVLIVGFIASWIWDEYRPKECQPRGGDYTIYQERGFNKPWRIY